VAINNVKLSGDVTFEPGKVVMNIFVHQILLLTKKN